MSVRLYIRRDIVEFLHYKLETIPPYIDLDFMNLNKGSLFKYDIYKFYWLLDKLINPKQNGLKPKENGFTPICSTYLTKWLGKEYKIYILYLINQGFIQSNNFYDDCICLRYILNIDNTLSFIKYKDTNYSVLHSYKNTTQVPINIDVNSISENKKINEIVEVDFGIKSKIYKKNIKEYELELGRNRKYPPFLKSMSQHFRKNLKINYDNALEYCKSYIEVETKKLELKLNNGHINRKEFEVEIKKLPNKHNQRIISINNLHFGKKNKSLKFNRNSSNKRVDTNLTFMAKDIRKFIIGIENMSYLDLSNSQPVLFNILLKKYYKNGSVKLKEEVKRYYLTTITGNWYEELSIIYKKDRETVKDYWMQIAYSENDDFKTLKNKFKKHYPKINELIEKIKHKHYKLFSKKLQRIESDIFIDEICKKLVDNGIIPYSIHDGVLVPIEHKDRTYSIMGEMLKNHLGSVPVISIDDIKHSVESNTGDALNKQFEAHFNN